MSIFVSIASYRDDVCTQTIQSLYENADKPENVFVGICQQNKEEDADCILNTEFENNPNIRIMRLPHSEAKGPTYARYLCSTLWKGEDYFFQVDSHSTFVESWDTKCIDMIKDIKEQGLSHKPILSHYPLEDKDYKDRKRNRTQVPRICKSYFNDRGIINLHAAEIIDTKDDFYKVPYVSGGMLFGPSSMLVEVPYDPNLPYLFTGEEILHSIRLYTAGYDIFTPKENIIFHEYVRDDKPKFWNDLKYDDTEAVNKLKYLLGLAQLNTLSDAMKVDLDKYGFQTTRSLQNFLDWTKIDMDKKQVGSNFCSVNNEATEKDIKESNELKEDYFCISCKDAKTRKTVKALTIGLALVIIAIIVIIILIGKKTF